MTDLVRRGRAGLARLLARIVAPILAGVLSLAAVGSVRAEVLLYASPTTEAFMAGVGGRQEALLAPWRRLLDDRGLRWREVRRPADLDGARETVLVLPSSVALDDVERAALRRFRDRGGGILASWALGARDGAGDWVGHGFLEELLGVSVAGELPDDSDARFLMPFGDLPVTRSVAAGRRIWLGRLPERPLLLRGGREAAAYLGWERAVFERGGHGVGMVFDEVDGRSRGTATSRRVVLGFSETAWGFQPDEVTRLVGDAMGWLLRRPTAHVAAWPSGLRAAQLVEMDTEDGFANAIHFAELMEELGVAGTFYCLSSEARRHPDLVKRLAAWHEIAFHGEVHLGFRGQTRAIQERRLRRMLDEMRHVLGERDGWPDGAGRGFRAPTEGYDATTEAVLADLGFDHHAADPNRSEDRLPMFSTAVGPDPTRPLVVLPRGQLDDLNYIQRRLSVDQVSRALVAEYELNRAMGGLALLSVHSQNFADPDRRLGTPRHTSLMTQAVEALVRHVASAPRDVWIAPASRIAGWWRNRARVGITTEAAGGDLLVTLAVREGRPVEGLTVLVAPPRAGAPTTATVTRGTPGRVSVRPAAGGAAALVVDALPPGTHQLRIGFR